MALLQFDKLINGQGLTPFFQPIVNMQDGERYGYEMLARSTLDGLQNPGVMFTTAAKLDLENRLSEVLRREGTISAMTMARPGHLFLNTHPKEINEPRLLASLSELRELAPQINITIEFHEAAVAQRDVMLRLFDQIRALEMKIAYDDFGAGQARLDELAEFPPDYLKFDIKLIREIDKATAGRLNLIESLVQVSKQLNTVTLAEGIETADEARVCQQLGFELAQGYYFGRPAPIEKYVP